MSKQTDSIETMEMNELLDLKAQVEARIESLAAEELSQLEERMERLRPYVKGSGRGRPGSKAAPKYRDPRTGKTWSGRGRTPVWLREREEKGESRDSFLIK